MAEFSDDQRLMVRNALDRWSKFLQGEVPHPGIHEQHFLPTGPISDFTMPNVPSNANRYMLRAIHVDIAWSKSQLMTYAKMGPFMLFGFVQPSKEKWQGTKVHVGSGTISPRTVKIPGEMFHYIRDKMAEVSPTQMRVSEAQQELINRTAMENIDRIASSKHFEAILYDRRLFGEEAIFQKAKD